MRTLTIVAVVEMTDGGIYEPEEVVNAVAAQLEDAGTFTIVHNVSGEDWQS